MTTIKLPEEAYEAARGALRIRSDCPSIEQTVRIALDAAMTAMLVSGSAHIASRGWARCKIKLPPQDSK